LGGNDNPTLPIGPGRSGTESPSPSPITESPTPTEIGLTQLVVEQWFTKGEQLYLTHTTVESQPAIGKATLEALLAGPPTTADPEVETQIPPDAMLLDLTINGGVAHVNLSQEFETLDDGCAICDELRLAQVVYTLTQFPTVNNVLFELEGQPIRTFGSHGILLDGPQDRKDFEQDAPPIVVETPYEGEEVASPILMTGTANVFEATVSYRLVDGAGNEIKTGFTTATCGTGCRGRFTERIKFEVSERTEAVLQVFESSAENGEPLHEVDIPLTLLP
jgi:hypothetical protein